MRLHQAFVLLHLVNLGTFPVNHEWLSHIVIGQGIRYARHVCMAAMNT